MNKRILIVDDEEDLCEILRFNLEAQGYDVEVAYSGEEALSKDLTQFHLLLLDVMMGEVSGFDVAKTVRSQYATPIVFLTALTDEEQILEGFNLGADDYIKKPYSIKEVLARVSSVLARSNTAMLTPRTIAYHTLLINIEEKKVFLEGNEIPFTKKEFGILQLLLEHRNKMFTRDEILLKVWTNEVCVLNRTVDVNIARIRKKIGPYGKNIVSRSGFGYAFNE